MSNTHNMKRLNFLGLVLISSLTILSCQKEENQFVRQDNQINSLVKNAELESDTLKATFNQKEMTLIVDKNGLSANYQIGTQNHFFQNCSSNLTNEKLIEGSILSAFNWDNYTNDQYNRIKQAIGKFELKQQFSLQSAKDAIAYINDSLKQYVEIQNLRLKNQEISKFQYDEIMTDVQDTFLGYLRSIYEEQKVYIECSTNYRCLLQEIQGILTEKQWEEFFSCVYKK